MGPSLRTIELAAWARARKLSESDETMLRAVFQERDTIEKKDLLIKSAVACIEMMHGALSAARADSAATMPADGLQAFDAMLDVARLVCNVAEGKIRQTDAAEALLSLRAQVRR